MAGLLCLLSGCKQADMSLQEFPDDARQKARHWKTTFVDQYWDGEGTVMYGRVRLADGKDDVPIVSRTAIYEGGYFAAAVHASRKLTFRAHGYAPIDIVHPGQLGQLHNVGELVLRRTKKSEQGRISGTVQGLSVGEKAEVTLRVFSAPPMWSDHGTEAGATSGYDVETVACVTGDRFQFDGVSLMAYQVVLRAVGYETIKKRLFLHHAPVYELGDLQLRPARVLSVDYVSQLTPDTDLAEVEVLQTTITCNGDSRFLFSDEVDSMGRARYLRIFPKREVVEASYWMSPSSFTDLGAGTLTEILQTETAKHLLTHAQGSRTTYLRPGRVYFFHCRGNRANCLFAVREQEP